jgi:hypothetical protein
MSQRLKLGAKSEIENMCVMFWCLTSAKEAEKEPAAEGEETMDTSQ